MHFSCNFDDLLQISTKVSGVVADSFVNDADKNITFVLMEDKAKLYGLTSQLMYNEAFPEDTYKIELNDEDKDDRGRCIFQLRSKDLIPYLNAYKGLRRTYVEEVIFSFEHGKVRCSVIERNNPPSAQQEQDLRESGEYDSYMDKRIVSNCIMDKIVVKPNRIQMIDIAINSTNVVDIPKIYLKMIMSNLIVNMENSTGVYGSMQFTKDYIITFNKSYNQVMNNFEPVNKVFSDIVLLYRFVAFINKVLLSEIQDESDVLRACVAEQYLYLFTDTVETLIVYNDKLAPTQNIIDAFVKTSYIDVDRFYLKDVLKRFSLNNDSIEVTLDVENSCLHLKSTRFEQDIDYAACDNVASMNGLKFKVMPSNFIKAIFGEDSAMVGVDESGNYTNLYVKFWFCSSADKKSTDIVFSDSTDSWFTLLHTKVY